MKVKVKVQTVIYIELPRESLTPETLNYGTRCQEISQFGLQTHAFNRERNKLYFCLPGRSWSSFTDLRGTEGWVDLVGYVDRLHDGTVPLAM